MKYTTEIRKDWEGNYQVGFTIGNQTFYLATYEDPTEKESRESAQNREKQLKIALNKLTESNN